MRLVCVFAEVTRVCASFSPFVVGVGVATYTWTFFNCTEAVVASVGNTRVESAARQATARATLVKKPKTACARLREECMGRCRVVECWWPADEASWACLVIDKAYTARPRMASAVRPQGSTPQVAALRSDLLQYDYQSGTSTRDTTLRNWAALIRYHTILV